MFLKQINLTCESGERPFCGTYQLNDNLWSGEEVFEMEKDNQVFQILKDVDNNEYCVSLRKMIKLCGKPNSEQLFRVKEGKRSVQPGYFMNFDFSECDVDDL